MVAGSDTILMWYVYKIAVAVRVEAQVHGGPRTRRDLTIMFMVGGKVSCKASPNTEFGDIGFSISKCFPRGAHARLGV